MPLIDHTIIRVSLPREGHDNTTLLKDVLNLLRAADPVGRVGTYSGVYEISEGMEGYSPSAESNPTHGESGKNESCSSLILTTYASQTVANEKIEKFIEDLASIHPWEHPVIEVISQGHTRIWCP